MENRKKTNKKILKYGCLPLVGFMLLLVAISIFTSGAKIDYNGEKLNTKREVNNFCLLSIEELTEKYGEPAIHTDEDGTIDYTWTLNKEKNIKAMLFESADGVREVARFFKFDFGTYFWDNLGWDKNNLEYNSAIGHHVVSDLNGIKKALYNENINVLNVELKPDLNPNTFGKN